MGLVLSSMKVLTGIMIVRYNGDGYMPCNGYVPCQPDSLPPWKNALRLEGAMPGWKEEWDGYQGVYKPPPAED